MPVIAIETLGKQGQTVHFSASSRKRSLGTQNASKGQGLDAKPKYKHIYTDKTTLKCDKEFDGKGAGARSEKEKRGGEDG